MDALDAALTRICWRQHGAFSTEQASAIGFRRDQIRHRVRTGEWERPAHGVLVIAGTPDSWERRAILALLARRDAALSHRAGGRALGLIAGSPPIEAVVPPGTSSASRLASLHRSLLGDDEITVVDGLRCTTAVRTILDLAPTSGPNLVRQLVDRAFDRRLTTMAAFERAMSGPTQLPSAAQAAVIDALRVWRPEVRPGSIAEARLLRQLNEWGLPPPERQIVVRDESGTVVARIDTGWSGICLGLEYDGIRWHGPAQWASDEHRHELLKRLGWTILHVDALDLHPGAPFRRRLLDRYRAQARRHPAAG